MILLLGILLLLQTKCTKQNVPDQYVINKSQGPHDTHYTPSFDTNITGIKLSAVVTVKPPEDGKYRSEDYTDDYIDIQSIPGKPGLDYPVLDKVPETSFSCEAKPEGYYADPETGCQVFHICLTQSVKNSFLCPNGSIFSQDLLTCDWWNRVDCESSENINQNKNYGEKSTRLKVQSTPEKSSNIVVDIRIGEGKNEDNMNNLGLNDFIGNGFITTSRPPQTVTESTTYTKIPVTIPVATTQRTTKFLQPTTPKSVLQAEDYNCSSVSKPLQIKSLNCQNLLNLEQIKSTTAPLSQTDQFSQTISDSSMLPPTNSLNNVALNHIQQHSELNIMLDHQGNDQDDSLVFPTSGSLRSNQRNFMIPELQFQEDLQSSSSPKFTTPADTFVSKTSHKAGDSLEHTEFSEGSPHLNKKFFVRGRIMNLFNSTESPSIEYLPHTSVSTMELPQHNPVSTSEQPQATTLSMLDLLQHTTVSKPELPQHTMVSTLGLPQHTTVSILGLPQRTAVSKLELPQHTTVNTLKLPQQTTVNTLKLPQQTTVNTLKLPQQFPNNANFYNQSNYESGYYYENSADSYSLQMVLGTSASMHVQSDDSKPTNDCILTKNCSHINSLSSDSMNVDKESTSHSDNTKEKSLFILGTLINPYFHESELNSIGYRQNKNVNSRNDTSTQDITDLYKNNNINSVAINRASTPVPFTYTESLQHPYTHFPQYKALTDVNKGRNQAVTGREQSTQSLNFKVSDILNLNRLNSVNEQHPLPEHTSNYRPTIVKSISFNFDTEEGRKQFDSAVSSGLFSDV